MSSAGEVGAFAIVSAASYTELDEKVSFYEKRGWQADGEPVEQGRYRLAASCVFQKMVKPAVSDEFTKPDFHQGLGSDEWCYMRVPEAAGPDRGPFDSADEEQIRTYRMTNADADYFFRMMRALLEDGWECNAGVAFSGGTYSSSFIKMGGEFPPLPDVHSDE